MVWSDDRMHSFRFFDALLVVMLECAVCCVYGCTSFKSDEDGNSSGVSSIVSVDVDAKCFDIEKCARLDLGVNGTRKELSLFQHFIGLGH